MELLWLLELKSKRNSNKLMKLFVLVFRGVARIKGVGQISWNLNMGTYQSERPAKM
jgi:hypothetical protein